MKDNYRMKEIFFLFFLFSISLINAQKTLVEGIVTDGDTGEPLPFVSVRFKDSKIGTFTDTNGYYILDTYYATDSIVFSFSGYLKVTKPVQLDTKQRIDVVLPIAVSEIEEVVVRAPDELPSTRLHKKIIAHKRINNKEKLTAYQYEVYNKIQFDLSNLNEKFKENGIVKRLDVILDYLEQTEDSTLRLPMILSESVSDYYYRKTPKRKKEVVKATRIVGVESVELNQFLGDMYLDVNIYDNTLQLFNKNFISPIANYARTFYRFYLEDSTFIDKYWCYKLKFVPKRTGDLTFEGEMWVHDTTYAIKEIKMTMSPWVNINYVQGMYLEHHFEQVEDEVWMITQEKLLVDLKLTKKSKLYGVYGRKFSSRKKFIINKPYPLEFYKTKDNVIVLDEAKNRSEKYWSQIRHVPLAKQEEKIEEMTDSLKNTPFYRTFKNTIYLATTGFYPLNKLEIGSAFSLFSYNQYENFRIGLALRTSNDFSRRIELAARGAYGFGDKNFKYGAQIRYNVTPKKRGMLTAFYNYDLEQIGQAPSAGAIGSTFGTLLRTGPLDKLTFVEKIGVNLEKDVKKDLILYGAFEWKEYTPVGKAIYLRPTSTPNVYDTLNRIQATELTARIRWAKDEEFISGAFDRKSIRTKYPILILQGVFGVKEWLGADYEYQKVDFFVQQNVGIGVFGRLIYNINVGKIFGTAAYPFLMVHPGNQSFWLQSDAFNKMNFFEFISDQYVNASIENHWDGFFLDRIPFNKYLKWRLVTTTKAAYGSISNKHQEEMILPGFVKQFGNTPYVETSIGIENIFNFFRVDLVWRLTHLPVGVKTTSREAFGVRFKYVINF